MAVSLVSFLLRELYLIFPEKERDTEIFLKKRKNTENIAQIPEFFWKKNAENIQNIGMIPEYIRLFFCGYLTIYCNFVTIFSDISASIYRKQAKVLGLTLFFRLSPEFLALAGQFAIIFEGFVN